jgi:hypothetical protein
MSQEKDDAQYARGGRDICVKVYLNAEEYMALVGITDEAGYVSHSDFFRRKLNEEVRKRALELSGMNGGDSSATPGPKRD